jgi:hypothetical protein
MTADQFISSGTSIAALLAAVATFLTVWQMAKQRHATYKPEIVVMGARVITAWDNKNPTSLSLFEWKRGDKRDTKTHPLGRDYPLFLANIGMGAATNVSVVWSFPMESFVAEVREFQNAHGCPVDIAIDKGAVSITSPPITSLWINQTKAHFDYILPASIENAQTGIFLPAAYILVVSVFMSVLLKNLNSQNRPAVPPLTLSIEFYDIAGKKHRMSYEIAFSWDTAGYYFFEGELSVSRV